MLPPRQFYRKVWSFRWLTSCYVVFLSVAVSKSVLTHACLHHVPTTIIRGTHCGRAQASSPGPGEGEGGQLLLRKNRDRGNGSKSPATTVRGQQDFPLERQIAAVIARSDFLR